VGAIDLVTAERLETLRALLAKDPVQNMLLLAVLEEYGLGRPGAPPFRFLGIVDGASFKAVLFVGGEGSLLIPSGNPNACYEIARHLAEQGMHLRSAVGEKAAVDAAVRAFGAIHIVIDRSQRLCSVSADDMGPFVAPQLRPAEDRDVDALVPLAAAAVQESLGVDALAAEGELFRSRIAARVKAGRTWLMTDGERVIFKVDMGARSRYGAELENPYLVPEMRKKGLGTLALGQVCRQQLSAIPRLTLRYDEKDPVLSRVCRKVGFVPVRSQRLVVAE
jgi:uncharacterized protein